MVKLENIKTGEIVEATKGRSIIMLSTKEWKKQTPKKGKNANKKHS